MTKPNLDRFWNLESLGIVESPLTSDDGQAINHFNIHRRQIYGDVALEGQSTGSTPELSVGSWPPQINITEVIEAPDTPQTVDNIIQEQLS